MRQIAGYDQSRSQIHVQVPDGIRDRIRLIIEPVRFPASEVSQPRARMKIQRNEMKDEEGGGAGGKESEGERGQRRWEKGRKIKNGRG